MTHDRRHSRDPDGTPPVLEALLIATLFCALTYMAALQSTGVAGG